MNLSDLQSLVNQYFPDNGDVITAAKVRYVLQTMLLFISGADLKMKVYKIKTSPANPDEKAPGTTLFDANLQNITPYSVMGYNDKAIAWVNKGITYDATTCFNFSGWSDGPLVDGDIVVIIYL